MEKKSTTNAANEHGRLIQKAHRQDRYSEKTPPRRGPIPAEIAQTKPVVPRNILRCLKDLSTDERAEDVMIDVPCIPQIADRDVHQHYYTSGCGALYSAT